MGGPKKEVRSAFFFGFFASSAAEMGGAFRLRDIESDWWNNERETLGEEEESNAAR